MKTLLKAFGIVLAASVVLFFVLKVAGIPPAGAAQLALTPFTGISWVLKKLEQLAKTGKEPEKLQTFHDFSMPFWKMLILASLSVIAVTELMSGLAVLIGMVGGGRQAIALGPDFVRMVSHAVIPIILYINFAFGRWIGVRARSRAYLAAVSVGVFCRIFDTGMTLALVPARDFEAAVGMERNVVSIATQLVVGMIIFGALSALGCWAGRRRRQAWYLDHLLKSIAPESRNTIIDIAYEEAQKTLTPGTRLARATGT